MSIHPSAVVEEGALLGADVHIGPLCYVQAGAVIGDGCRLIGQATVYGCVRLGAGSEVHPTAVLGGTPQDMNFTPETESRVEIGAGCVLREGFTIHRGTEPGSLTQLGEGCFCMAYSHVAHNCKVEREVIMANSALLAGHVEIGAQAFISANTCIHQFVRVGRLAMMSGVSAISKDLPPFFTTHGVSGNKVSGINTVGLRRAGFNPEERLNVKKAFRILYLNDLNTRDAVARIREEIDSPGVTEICDFIEAGKRGICSYYGK